VLGPERVLLDEHVRPRFAGEARHDVGRSASPALIESASASRDQAASASSSDFGVAIDSPTHVCPAVQLNPGDAPTRDRPAGLSCAASPSYMSQGVLTDAEYAEGRPTSSPRSDVGGVAVGALVRGPQAGHQQPAL